MVARCFAFLQAIAFLTAYSLLVWKDCVIKIYQKENAVTCPDRDNHLNPKHVDSLIGKKSILIKVRKTVLFLFSFYCCSH